MLQYPSNRTAINPGKNRNNLGNLTILYQRINVEQIVIRNVR